jgi:uncharacterized membrane protein YfcA
MEDLTLTLTLLLLAAAFMAGFVDSIAGGGGLIAVPALLLAGLSPVEALGTNKLQGLFGSASATVAYARKGHVDLKTQLAPAALSALGAALGALLATVIPGDVFRAFLPFLLVAIALYFALKPNMDDIDRARRLSAFLFGLIVVPLIGFYDGVFGPGTGSFFMLAFVALAGYGLLKATAHTKLLNFASNLGAFAVFAFVGVISWKIGLMMGAAQFAGAQTGSRLAMKNGARIIKPLLVITCVALAVKLISDPASTLFGSGSGSDRSEHRQKNRARGNQGNAEPVHHRKVFAQKQHPEDRDKHDRQLVERRHPRRVSQFESPEIGKPGCTGGQSRKAEKNPGLERDGLTDGAIFPSPSEWRPAPRRSHRCG